MDLTATSKTWSNNVTHGGNVHLGDVFHFEDTVARQRRQLLASLRFDDMNLRQNDIDESHGQTFEWIFNDEIEQPWDNFSVWLREGKGIYWIEGKAGSGKSTFMKFLATHRNTHEELAKWSTDSNPTILTFFFWLSGSKLQRSTKGLLSSLTHQLLLDSESLIDSLLEGDVQVRHKYTLNDWSVRELRTIFKKLLTIHAKAVCIFLDGLDELDQKESTHDLLELIFALQKLHLVKTCASSRPELTLFQNLLHFQRLRLQDLTAKDIETTVRDVLGKHFDQSLTNLEDKDLLRKIVELVLQKADGVFLWVHLALKSALTGLSHEDEWLKLEERIEALPKGMENLFDAMLKRADSNVDFYREEAALVFAYKELDVSSLLAITLAMDTDFQESFPTTMTPYNVDRIIHKCAKLAKKIQACFGGLIEVRETILGSNSDILRYDCPSFASPEQHQELARNCWARDIQYLHRTARDYLLSDVHGKEIVGNVTAPRDKLIENVTKSHLAVYHWMLEPSSALQEIVDELDALRVCNYQGTALFPLVDEVAKHASYRSGKPKEQDWYVHYKSTSMHLYGSAVDFLGEIACAGHYNYLQMECRNQVNPWSPYYYGYLLSNYLLRNAYGDNYDYITSIMAFCLSREAELFVPQCYSWRDRGLTWCDKCFYVQLPYVMLIEHVLDRLDSDLHRDVHSKTSDDVIGFLKMGIGRRETCLVCFAVGSCVSFYVDLLEPSTDYTVLVELEVDSLALMFLHFWDVAFRCEEYSGESQLNFTSETYVLNVVRAREMGAGNNRSFPRGKRLRSGEVTSRVILNTLVEGLAASYNPCLERTSRALCGKLLDLLDSTEEQNDITREDFKAILQDRGYMLPAGAYLVQFDPYEEIGAHNWKERGPLKDWYAETHVQTAKKRKRVNSLVNENQASRSENDEDDGDTEKDQQED